MSIKKQILNLLSELPSKSMVVGHFNSVSYTADELMSLTGSKRTTVHCAISSIKKKHIPIINANGCYSIDPIYLIWDQWLTLKERN